MQKSSNKPESMIAITTRLSNGNALGAALHYYQEKLQECRTAQKITEVDEEARKIALDIFKDV